MVRVLSIAIATASLVGCGRVSFDPRADDAATHDQAPGDQAPGELVLHLPFVGSTTDVAGGRVPLCSPDCPPLVGSRGTGDQAARFTGSECLEYADDPALRPAQFTFATWFRASGLVTVSVLGKAYEADTMDKNSYELWIQDNGLVHFSTVNGATPYLYSTGYTAGTWHHFAGTFDGTTKRMYVDGALVDEGTASPTSYDQDPLRVGCDRQYGAVQNYFLGEIDDVRLYNRALSQDEIAALAQ